MRAAGVLAILAASLSAQNRPVFEENFESGKLDPAMWDQRVTGMAARSYAFIVATHLPESVRMHFFGRAYTKITPGLGTTHNYLSQRHAAAIGQVVPARMGIQ